MPPLEESVKNSLLEEILRIARTSAIFHPMEIDILREVARDAIFDDTKGYRLITLREGEGMSGFVIFGRAPMTENAWDIYWVAVDASLQKKGLGSRLLSLAEAEILANTQGSPIIRVETSSRDIYTAARALYRKAGYQEAGLISDFYKKNDSLVTFSKKL